LGSPVDCNNALRLLTVRPIRPDRRSQHGPILCRKTAWPRYRYLSKRQHPLPDFAWLPGKAQPQAGCWQIPGILNQDRVFCSFNVRALAASTVFVARQDASYNFDGFHQLNRIKKMQADEFIRTIVTDAISVMLKVDVLDAQMALSLHFPRSPLKNSFFSFMSSG